MGWIEGICDAIDYIEKNITEELTIENIAKQAYVSPFYFQKGFAMLCGFTVGEFSRFHGVTPTAVRKEGAMIKSFAALKIKFSLEGGFVVDYRIIEKEAFTVKGASKMFSYEEAKTEIPKFWTEHYQLGKGEIICGMYGVCIDDHEGTDEFEYLIADNYYPSKELPGGYVTKLIPKHTWAVFACKGPMPHALQDIKSLQGITSRCIPM